MGQTPSACLLARLGCNKPTAITRYAGSACLRIRKGPLCLPWRARSLLATGAHWSLLLGHFCTLHGPKQQLWSQGRDAELRQWPPPACLHLSQQVSREGLLQALETRSSWIQINLLLCTKDNCKGHLALQSLAANPFIPLFLTCGYRPILPSASVSFNVCTCLHIIKTSVP